jgi:hypothetical protein
MTKDEAIAQLKELCPVGSTVYTVLRHVSRSGMARHISAYVIKDGEPVKLDWRIAAAGIFKMSNLHGGLIVRGYGMDMGFHLVYTLGAALYSSGESDSDGGYTLNQRWL